MASKVRSTSFCALRAFMKFIVAVLLILESLPAKASEQFSAADYSYFVKEEALRFDIDELAQNGLEALGLTGPNSCDKAILAAVAGAIFQKVEREGGSYPKSIHVREVILGSQLPGINVVRLVLGNQVIYSVRYFPNSSLCIATSLLSEDL